MKSHIILITTSRKKIDICKWEYLKGKRHVLLWKRMCHYGNECRYSHDIDFFKEKSLS